MTTGERVRAIRRARGWSQLELASRAGCASSTVSAAERGPSSERLWCRLAEALGVERAALGDDVWCEAAVLVIRGAKP